jgi:hypothetical protein
MRIKADKAVTAQRVADSEYRFSVEKLAEIHSTWVFDMKTACIVILYFI